MDLITTDRYIHVYIPFGTGSVVIMRYITRITRKHKKKRWGRKFIDRREWTIYNEQLVKRGEFLLDLEWVNNWKYELDTMNKNKRGRPFIFPDSLIKLQAVWHAKNISLRMIEGITRKLYDMAQLPSFNDYSTISRRINRLDFDMIIPDGKNITLWCDGSGFQAIGGGEYLRDKYGKKHRQWIQVIILGDSKTKEPVSVEVNLVQLSESESAERQLGTLIDGGANIKKFGGDGALDDIDLWKLLEKHKIKSSIKPRLNADVNGPCKSRNRSARTRKKKGYKLWAIQHGYGMRWCATEGIFSAMKRVFGEQLNAKRELGLIQEAKSIVWAYRKMKKFGEA